VVSIQKIKIRSSWGGGFRNKGKGGLVEDDMTRDDDLIASEIKAG
jgi:hypothetical protein